MVGRRAFSRSGDADEEDERLGVEDIETGLKKPKPKFRDIVELALAKQTTDQLKKQLTQDIDINEYKKYWKSDDEVPSQIHERKVC